MTTKIKPCPFCGLQSHQDWDGMCYKIACADTYGGCGASLVADSREEAIDKWNRRVE